MHKAELTRKRYKPKWCANNIQGCCNRRYPMDRLKYKYLCASNQIFLFGASIHKNTKLYWFFFALCGNLIMIGAVFRSFQRGSLRYLFWRLVQMVSPTLLSALLWSTAGRRLSGFLSSTFITTTYKSTITGKTYLLDEHILHHFGQFCLEVGMKVVAVEETVEVPVELVLSGALFGRHEDPTGWLAVIWSEGRHDVVKLPRKELALWK